MEHWIFLAQTAFSAGFLSLTVLSDSPCEVACIHICVHITDPSLSLTTLWIHESTANTGKNR